MRALQFEEGIIEAEQHSSQRMQTILRSSPGRSSLQRCLVVSRELLGSTLGAASGRKSAHSCDGWPMPPREKRTVTRVLRGATIRQPQATGTHTAST